MRELFRYSDREGVRYLLIGGHAAILYGAAQFTQDLDVWIAPSRAETLAFLRARGFSGSRWVEALQAAGAFLDERMANAVRLGRACWLPRIEQLREMRSQGALVPPGTPVRDLLRSLV